MSKIFSVGVKYNNEIMLSISGEELVVQDTDDTRAEVLLKNNDKYARIEFVLTKFESNEIQEILDRATHRWIGETNAAVLKAKGLMGN